MAQSKKEKEEQVTTRAGGRGISRLPQNQAKERRKGRRQKKTIHDYP